MSKLQRRIQRKIRFFQEIKRAIEANDGSATRMVEAKLEELYIELGDWKRAHGKVSVKEQP